MDKDQAAEIFGVKAKAVGTFNRIDPFNDIEVEGFICRKRNKNGGSLIITRVGKWECEQIIWATPKLAYPYQDVGNTDYINFGKFANVYLAEKYNGMNVLFYKYKKNKLGHELITAKSKGTPFISDSEAGPFLTLLREVMENQNQNHEFKMSYKSWTKDETSHAISYELCGKKEPHLVNYGFDISLIPLFSIHIGGKIRPVKYYGNKLGCFFSFDSSDTLVEFCKETQKQDLFENEMYRKENGLEHRYEYDRFITEGKVLYVLDEDGFVKNRTMYKVKPSDVEEVHWQRFDEVMEARVDEAVKKCIEREYDVTAENVKEELDMAEKEWGKFGKSVTKYLEEKELVK